MTKSLPQMLDEEIKSCPSVEDDSGFGALALTPDSEPRREGFWK